MLRPLAGSYGPEDGPYGNDTVTNTYNNRLRTALSLAQPTGKWTNDFAHDLPGEIMRPVVFSVPVPFSCAPVLYLTGRAKRLTNVTSPAGAFGYSFVGQASRLTQKLALPNTSYITNTYDPVARLLSTTLKNCSHTTLNRHTYAYNLGNQRTQQTFNSGSTYNYTYDPIGQLQVADSATASEDRGCTYDTAWNLNYRTNNTTLNTFKVDGKNQLTNASPVGVQTYDANGNLLGNGGASDWLYTYDDENQLIGIEREEVWRTELVYDGKGRLRVRKDYDWSDAWVLNTETRYLYDAMRVIYPMRYSEQIEIVALATSGSTGANVGSQRLSRGVKERSSSNVPQVSYTRGTDLSGSLEGLPRERNQQDYRPMSATGDSKAFANQRPILSRGEGGIGGLLARSHGYSAGNWSTHNYYHADGNGNITYLVNSSQGLAAKYRHDPYGNAISSSGTLASANVYRFSSKEFHSNSGLYYYGYRWYHPNLQRWPNRDPIEERGGINMYAFVRNEPIHAIDPFGEEGTNFPIIYPPIKIPTWPPPNPWPTHPASADAEKGVVTIHTANAAPACPAAPPKPCSKEGERTRGTEPALTGVTCSDGRAQKCYEYEECKVDYAGAKDGIVRRLSWQKVRKCNCY